MTYGPTEKQNPEQPDTPPVWQQPSFAAREPEAPVWGQVLVPGETRIVVAPPTQEEQTLRTLRRLVFPVALVIAVVTGHWFPALVLAIVIGSLLKRQLFHARQRRLMLSTSLR